MTDVEELGSDLSLAHAQKRDQIMSETELSAREEYDYTKGEARHHHRFYERTGDIVIQVQSAILKVHLRFLTKYSNILAELIEVPRSEQDEGTESRPLLIHGDDVHGWEALLSYFYPEDHFKAYSPSWEEAMNLWPMAEKYQMASLLEVVEQHIQEKTKTMQQVVRVTELARRLARVEAAKQAVAAVVRDRNSQYPTFQDAKRMGFFPFYALVHSQTGRCIRCGHFLTTRCSSNCHGPQRTWPPLDQAGDLWME